jgi:hypothetical protein
MKNNLKRKKDFDSVEMMRQIRDQLADKYLRNPKEELEDLQKIHQKYKLKTPSKSKAL